MRKIRVSSVLLFVCVLAGYTAFGQSIPTEMIGTWSGLVKLESSGRTYTARLILKNANVGEFAGNVVYSELKCDADITLKYVKDGRAMFREKITSNKFLCVDDGDILLTPVPDNPRKLNFFWAKKVSNMVVTGVLERQ